MIHQASGYEMMEQDQICHELWPGVVADDMQALHLATEKLGGQQQRVIDEQAAAARSGGGWSGGWSGGCHVLVTQIGLVTPERPQEQRTEKRDGIVAGGWFRLEGVEGTMQGLGLVRGKGVMLMPGAVVIVANGLQQSLVKVGLGEEPGKLEPGATLPAGPGVMPEAGRIADGTGRGDQAAVQLVLESGEPSAGTMRVGIGSDDAINDAGLALGDGALGERARL